jgi:hypothetical protein
MLFVLSWTKGKKGMAFRTIGSNLSPKQFLLKIREGLEPTREDLLYAGERQRTRILDRTAAGRDVNGHPFRGYSTKGPYYYNPSSRNAGRASVKSQKAAAQRLLRRITTRAQRPRSGAPRLSSRDARSASRATPSSSDGSGVARLT